jgi:hypothetical protein
MRGKLMIATWEFSMSYGSEGVKQPPKLWAHA